MRSHRLASGLRLVSFALAFLPASLLHAAEGPPPSAQASPPPAPTPKPESADVPPGAHVVVGPHEEYRPFLRFEPKGVLLQADFQLAGRVEGVDSIPVDRNGNKFQSGVAISPMLRAGLRIDTRKLLGKVVLHAEYEHDLPTGTWTSQAPLEGQEYPNSQGITQQLRKLYLRASIGPYLHVGGGFMTNQWGLGLVANDGAQGAWTPGSARFADPRGGDRVLRGFLGTGPLGAARITATFAVDQVRGDDVLLPGDKAFQVSAAIAAGHDRPWGGGVFVVHRRQTTQDGAETDVTAVDFAGRYWREVAGVSFGLEGELAVVLGQTTLGPTTEFPTHDVRQVGGALRFTARGHYLGGVLDFLYASGDGNPDNGRQTAFKADPNYEMGLLLYRYVLAAQTARAPYTASDPTIVGVPSPGLERLPTRGSPTNTIAVFPRLVSRPFDGFEMYGGPLFAWSAAPLVDPINTRFAGGAARNALNGDPGKFLGVEFDLGVRYRMLLKGSEITVGAEGGELLPGSAFVNAAGANMGRIVGGRAILQYRL